MNVYNICLCMAYIIPIHRDITQIQIYLTLHSPRDHLKHKSYKNTMLVGVGNSDDWCTQNCPPQDCPPRGQFWGGQLWGSPPSLANHVEQHVKVMISLLCFRLQKICWSKKGTNVIYDCFQEFTYINLIISYLEYIYLKTLLWRPWTRKTGRQERRTMIHRIFK